MEQYQEFHREKLGRANWVTLITSPKVPTHEWKDAVSTGSSKSSQPDVVEKKEAMFPKTPGTGVDGKRKLPIESLI